MDWELNWMDRANGWWSSSALDRVLPWLTHLGSTVAVLVFVVLSWLFTEQPRFRYGLLLLYGIQSAIAYSLKYLVRRQRPPSSSRKTTRLEIIDPSFPSVHTLWAFMMATVLGHWFPSCRFLFFLIAGFVGWTRIYLGLHFPTDVLGGGLLGYGLTRLFLHRFDLSFISS